VIGSGSPSVAPERDLMPSPTFAPRRELFVVRRGGTREFGSEWPEGARCKFRPDNHVLQFEGGSAQHLRTSQQGDVLRRAMDAVVRGTTKRARVGVAVGSFGEDTLYEEVGRFQDPEWKPVSRDLPANAKTVHLKIAKVTGEEIEGLANTPSIDRGYDRIEPAAFVKWLPKFMENPAVLFNHDFFWPIGSVLDIAVKPEGLWCRCRIDDETVRQWIAEKRVRAFSVSFIPHARRWEPNPKAAEVDPSGERRGEPSEIRVITEAELLEITVCTIPMNRESLFSVAKSLDAGTDLVCRGCGSAGVSCDCDGGSRVVAPRSFPVSAADTAFRFDGREIVRTFGARGLRQACAWSDGEDPFDASHCLFPHHHLDEGELRLSAEGLKVAMARLLAAEDDLSPGDRKGVHAHLAAHYRELGIEPPAYDDAPDRGAFFKTAFAGATRPVVALVAERMSPAALVKWAADRGFGPLDQREREHDGKSLVPLDGWDASNGRRSQIELADGVSAVVLTRTAETKSAEEPVVNEPKNTPAPTPKAADPATDEGDEYLEVDPSLLHELESATKDPDAPIDGDLAERLLDQCAAAVEANNPESKEQ
jgi:HK97 family phage prohead protease